MNADWWRDAVIYQIYPRSFADSNDDGLGDITGVTAHMDYLSKLHIDAIWLSPFYPSPLADGGYDVSDYRNVDPRLGTLGDFDNMVSAAHAAGIKVVVDIVPNHTSEQHPWFQAALAAGPGSPERERYIFRWGKGEHGEQPPTNWQGMFGGPAWHQVADGQWYLHLFAPEQPDLNWQHTEVRADFLNTLRFWSDRGVDGFRIDVAHGLIKDLREPLRDVRYPEIVDAMDVFINEPDTPLWDRDEVHDIFREWHQVLAQYDPPRMTVGECWTLAARRVLYTRPDELSQAFNFELLRCPWDAQRYQQVISESIATAAAGGTVSTWVLSNHDVVRHASRLALPASVSPEQWLAAHGQPAIDEALGLKRALAATMLALALPGSAYIYQGEELGLPEVYDLPDCTLQDPTFMRTAGRLRGRDGCRVPLPWSPTGPAFGFSSRAAWLPQPPNFSSLAVSVQEQDPHSTLAFYRQLLSLRRQYFSGEQLTWLDEYCTATTLGFTRDPQGTIVLLNTGSKPCALPAGTVLISSQPCIDQQLPANSAAWLIPQ